MTNEKHAWVYDLLLILVLAIGTYLRVIGLNWDDNQHLHPDERFMTMVESALQVRKCAAPNTTLQNCPPDQVQWLGLGDYFNTATSTLNPENQGYAFFVYGDLPTIVVRYLAEWTGQVGYDQVYLIGRQVSALADLLTILLLYIIVARLYNRRVALLSAAFSALAVLQIQQSHFFTVDTFGIMFMYLAIYFAVEILIRQEPTFDARYLMDEGRASNAESRIAKYVSRLVRDPFFLLSLGFGVSLGVATASKLDAAPLAIVLPGAFLVRYLTIDRKAMAGEHDPSSTARPPLSTDYWTLIFVYLAAGAVASILSFRVFMPYAFRGLGLSPSWISTMQQLIAQSSGDADVPFALQWARRTHLYSFTNLTVWGLGLPLGILAWLGFLWMAWRIFKGELRHALLWGWTAIFFTWQSLAFNPTMRYQLPIYPLLGMMAGWFVIHLWDQAKAVDRRLLTVVYRVSSVVIGVTVLILALAWAYAFTRIYTRPVTRVAATYWIYQNVPAAINLRIQTAGGSVYQQPLPFPAGGIIQSNAPYDVPFTANASGALNQIYFPHIAAKGDAASQTFGVSVTPQSGLAPGQELASASLTSDFVPSTDPRGKEFTLQLDRAVMIQKGQTYLLHITTTGAVTMVGAAPINESDWDDGLPLRLGPQGYDGYGGLYQSGLNLQIYFDDNADKLTRFVSTLGQGDYIFMSSNRQWASVTRLPERYPLTTAYYRALVGCPPDKDVIWCYNVATPGMFQGQLGYKLVAVFESFPTLNIPGIGTWQINDQSAEEAFTVYDHPKVLIFQKQPDFSAAKVQAILGAVDISNVVHLTPKQASSYKSLMLPPTALAQQQAGGTWSRLFNYNWIQNQYPAVGLIIWYLFIFILGVITYPIVRFAFPGLGVNGYPISRALGLVILGYLAWLGGSVGVPYTRTTIAVIFVVLAGAGLGLGWMRRKELAEEWKSHKTFFLMVEGLFLAFFLFDLLIRIGNPDLWHPAKGGERPMDFSFFSAILKSTTFPPYDPWFAGGYINYYYYGFVLVATPVKLLGIVPTIAYNFILPTLFSIVAMGAFCVGWNLIDGRRSTVDGQRSIVDGRFVAGLLAALLMVVLGNLGTMRMLYQGFERMAAPGGNIDNVSIPQRWVWASEGFIKSLTGQPLPYGQGDWYWDPSRIIPPGPGNEITEFPFFTFLYSDLHAHMLAMPLALLALAWALAVIKSRRVSLFQLLIGALVIGALYPTNLSDIYTYLPIGIVAVGYVLWRSDASTRWKIELPDAAKKLILILGSAAFLALFSYVLYWPYHAAYSQGYSALDPWTASQTPIWSYLAHWGVFLFIITCWLAWETHEWMASTPVSSLNKLRPYQVLIEAGIAFFLVALLYLMYRQVEIGWVALPLAVWAGLLILRPDQSDVKRFVLFLVGTSMLITIVVEIVVVRGDIGRMNTIFKFYLQAWAMLSVSAGAAFVWTLADVHKWRPAWRNIFQGGVTLLLAGAAMYTVSATLDKIGDRMAPNVPLTLDSITYMKYAQYADFGVTMNLNQDYQAIRWMQDNVQGSPVIVEANCPEYHWCTRFTIYTGLPGVVGWNWHERQQRTLTPQLVENRIAEIAAFYTTTDPQAAVSFLKKYNVQYIIVGQLERAEYPGPGLDKFDQYNGQLWDSVYRQGSTAIYKVNP